MKGYSKAELIHRLSEVNWNCVSQCVDVNVAWNRFKTVFVNIIDTLAPMKRACLKQRSEPWFDETISNCIKIRDQLLSEFKILYNQIHRVQESQKLYPTVDRKF